MQRRYTGIDIEYRRWANIQYVYVCVARNNDIDNCANTDPCTGGMCFYWLLCFNELSLMRII